MEKRPTRAHNKYTKESLAKVHNYKYDYSKYIYYGAEKLSTFICPEHGEFQQSPYGHFKGYGCKKCGAEKSRNAKFKSLDYYLDKFREVHGDKYDYSKSDYKKATSNIKIVCPEHGEFFQSPYSHSNGQGCPECGLVISGLKRRSNTENFIRKAKKVHGDRFDYSETHYVKNNEKVKIKCSEGHEFYQTPANHLSGYGCSYCQISPLHMFLHNNLGGILNDRSTLDGKEIDLYFPEQKIALEINGVYYHSADFVKSNYHQEKVDLAAEKGISLFHVWYDKDTNFDLILSWARSKLNMIDRRIFARKTIIKNIDTKDYSSFLNETHLQGATNSKCKYGLFYNDELVSVMGFSYRSNEWTLDRFSSKKDVIVVGGFSKLFKNFIKEHNPKKVITYSDFSYSDGSVYFKNGFKKESVSSGPRLYYTDGIVLKNRRSFQRKNIKSRNPKIRWGKEKDMARAEGFVPLYGCKTIKWVYENGES